MPRADFAMILANASWVLFEQGVPAQAMQLLSTAQVVGDTIMPNGQLPLATVYRTFGGIYLDINKPKAALDNLSRQSEITKTTGKPDDSIVAHGYTNVALAELGSGDYESAGKKLDIAQQIWSRHPGKAESYRAMTLDVRGISQGLAGDYQNAIINPKEAIALYDEDNGAGNYMTAL